MAETFAKQQARAVRTRVSPSKVGDSNEAIRVGLIRTTETQHLPVMVVFVYRGEKAYKITLVTEITQTNTVAARKPRGRSYSTYRAGARQYRSEGSVTIGRLGRQSGPRILARSSGCGHW